MFMLNVIWSAVCLNRLLRTLCGLASRLISMYIRMPSRSDSSRRSATPSSFLSLTRSAIFSSSADLFTWYGSSLTMIAIRSPLTSSNATWARITTRPRPWAYIWRIASIVSQSPLIVLRWRSNRKIVPPVGKSGPVTCAHRSSVVISGSSIRAIVASTISPRWWGGMFVAMPTAMPDEPLMSRFGSFDGSTVGWRWVPS